MRRVLSAASHDSLSFALIGFTIISTSFISGLFGMAGGMILVGVLLVYFDVATGMVIFSIIQFVANGWRAVLWWRFVLWRIFFVYVLGAVLSFAVMRYVAIVPSKAVGVSRPRVDAVPDRAAARCGRGRTSNGAACRSSPAC